MAHDQEVVGSNPGTDGCKQFASYYIKRKIEIKVAKWGTPKKKNIYLKKKKKIYKNFFKEISKIILHDGGLLLFLLFVINKIIQLEVILKIVMFSRFLSDRKNEVIFLKDRCCLIFCCF